ncbi:MAG: hypothetical protein WC757_03415 [Candidatus Paceibacterota bacterium]|jgi:hypothetical protein
MFSIVLVAIFTAATPLVSYAGDKHNSRGSVRKVETHYSLRAGFSAKSSNGNSRQHSYVRETRTYSPVSYKKPGAKYYYPLLKKAAAQPVVVPAPTFRIEEAEPMIAYPATQPLEYENGTPYFNPK